MGFKLYNGCPNDELAAHWAAQDKAKEFIRSRGLGFLWNRNMPCVRKIIIRQ